MGMEIETNLLVPYRNHAKVEKIANKSFIGVQSKNCKRNHKKLWENTLPPPHIEKLKNLFVKFS